MREVLRLTFRNLASSKLRFALTSFAVLMVTARELELKIDPNLRITAVMPKPYSPTELVDTVNSLFVEEATRSV